MINLNAYVIELDDDNRYKVSVENVYTGVVAFTDDVVITFESALARVIEMMLSYDYDYVEVAQGLSRKGRPARKYVISIDNGD